MSEWIGLNEDYLDYLGFVYKITNLVTGQYYIGLKLIHHKRTLKPLRGRTKTEKLRISKLKTKNNKRHITVESDWRTYWGSNNELLLDIEKLGEDNFKREITHYCKTKFDCAYTELLEQLAHDVLFDENAYNGIINVRLSRKKKKNDTK